uniref:Uncharacterized protein n=1 Tax=Terrapene triunguis TaxID=2587831 RepID=A0A674IVK9_9SAUR
MKIAVLCLCLISITFALPVKSSEENHVSSFYNPTSLSFIYVLFNRHHLSDVKLHFLIHCNYSCSQNFT